MYQKNAEKVVETLGDLDEELRIMLAPVRGRPVMLVHPSLAYFLARYEIPVAGYVEPMPGRKPTPQDLRDLILTAREQDVRAIFSEVQLSRQSIEAVAEALGLPLYELDPLGGPGRESYAELLRYNARELLKALE
jgi:zinc transport system substrate-binding protein